MKLYIKSIDAPLSCKNCIYQEYDEDSFPCCRINGAYAEPNERSKNCPLSEIPTPHGRLIDADRLIAVLKSAISYEQRTSTFFCVIKNIENAPTVIEAEDTKR